MTSGAAASAAATVEFQIISDIHHYPEDGPWENFDIPVRAKYLILAGDIGHIFAPKKCYLDFIIKQVRAFEHVFLVLGNHEFFGSRGKNFDRVIAEAEGFENVEEIRSKFTFLSNTRADLVITTGTETKTHITILGTTLWSYIGEYEKKNCKDHGDYQCPGFNFTRRLEEFWKSYNFLQDATDRVREEEPGGMDRKILIISHHAPSRTGTSEPGLENSPIAGFYSTNLLSGAMKILGLQKGDVWVFGHTHHCVDLVESDVRLFANQRGNPPFRYVPGHDFDVNAVISV